MGEADDRADSNICVIEQFLRKGNVTRLNANGGDMIPQSQGATRAYLSFGQLRF
jgi:hypothetical protein